MEYRGYLIQHVRDYYQVVSQDGSSWTEDTVQDAKKAIDEQEGEEYGS